MLQLGPGAARILQGSSQLQKLSLRNAQLGDSGTEALADVLSTSSVTMLVELELSGCGIGKAGMERLLHVLRGFKAPALEVKQDNLLAGILLL